MIDHAPTIRTFSTLPMAAKPERGEEFVDQLRSVDDQMGRVMAEAYGAFNSGFLMLAAVGLRTAFEYAATLQQIEPSLPHAKMLAELVATGVIGRSEAERLNVVIEAGNAAAHRGFGLSKERLEVLFSTFESFLRHTLLGSQKAILEIGTSIPRRPKRKKAFVGAASPDDAASQKDIDRPQNES